MPVVESLQRTGDADGHHWRPASLPGRVLHRLLLHGLRPERLPHDPAPPQRQLEGSSWVTLAVAGSRGQRLAGWVALPAASAGAAPVVVAVHGWGSNASSLWQVVEPLTRAGIAVVLFDAANHGASSAEAFSSLPRFADDLAAVRTALTRLPALDTSRLVLLGHSVGAAAALLHAYREGGVRAVVSLSAFAHPREVMERWLRAYHLPRRVIGTAILEQVQRTIGTDFDRIAPVKLIAAIGCPVLLVHGARDETVPLADAEALRRRLRRGELLVVDGGHDLRDALAEHEHRIIGFIQTHLSHEQA